MPTRALLNPEGSSRSYVFEEQWKAAKDDNPLIAKAVWLEAPIITVIVIQVSPHWFGIVGSHQSELNLASD
jgi:hypothetical protein